MIFNDIRIEEFIELTLIYFLKSRAQAQFLIGLKIGKIDLLSVKNSLLFVFRAIVRLGSPSYASSSQKLNKLCKSG